MGACDRCNELPGYCVCGDADSLRARVAELESTTDMLETDLCEERDRNAELERERNAAIARVAALAQDAGRADAMRERIAELERERNCERDARIAIDKAWMRTAKERDEISAAGGLRFESVEAKKRIAELDRDLAEALERAADAEAERDRLVASHDAAVPRTRALHERIKELEAVLQRTADACDSAADVIRDHLADSYPYALEKADSAVVSARTALSSGNGGARCQCQMEAGDSPCGVHGDEECLECGQVFVRADGHECVKRGEEVPRD